MTQNDREATAAGDPGDPVGTVAEEAAKLLGALSGWAREQGDGVRLAEGVAGWRDTLREHVATGSPECTWCPVCRTVHALRRTSPEVQAHLTSAASSLLLALSGMMSTPAPQPPSPSGAPGVERIELDDDWPEGEPG